MILKTKKFAISGYAALFLSLCLMALALPTPARAGEEKSGRAFATDTKLEQLAEAAQCAAEHGDVARQYRLRAEHLEAKAVKHEEKAAELEARPKRPMQAKWPAMARKPWVKEREMAVQARRAAKEAQQLADRHVRLGVETLTASCNTSIESPVGN